MVRASRRRRLYVVAFLTGLTFVVGVAFAQWLATGTGSGRATAAVAEPLTTATSTASSGGLYPGGSGDLHLVIVNPNPYAVTVSTVAGNGTITSDTAGCDATTHAVTFTDQTDLALYVGPTTSASHALAGAVAMGISAADACQGASFTIPVALTGYSGTTAPDTGTDPGTDPGTGPQAGIDVGACSYGTLAEDGVTILGGQGPVPEDPTNQLDDNCNGITDETDDLVYRDADEDSFGDPATGGLFLSYTLDQTGYWIGSIAIDAGYVDENTDCDDTDPTVNPAATDTPDDGVDQDCDGVDATA